MIIHGSLEPQSAVPALSNKPLIIIKSLSGRWIFVLHCFTLLKEIKKKLWVYGGGNHDKKSQSKKKGDY